MNPLLIIGIFMCVAVLIFLLLKSSECKHEEKIYYDAEGDELPGDQSEACFCECKNCGKTFVIPSGFQSDAHFEHYLLYGGGPKR
jgi:hypothetical protein